MKRVVLLGLFLGGCGVFIQPTTPDGINSYNDHLFQLLTPLITPVVVIIGVIVSWIKSNLDKHELKQETKAVATDLATSTEIARDKVLDRIAETHEGQTQALTEANNTNAKILALQEQAASAPPRAPRRSTD